MSDEINNRMDCRFYAVSLATELELDRFLKKKKQQNEKFNCRYPSTGAAGDRQVPLRNTPQHP